MSKKLKYLKSKFPLSLSRNSAWNAYKNWRLKRHIKKFGSKNNGYFNYFNVEWFEEHQETLIWLLNHWLLKYWFRWILRIHKDCKFSEYIDEIKPHTYRIKVGENTYRSDFRTHQKFSKRIYYAFRLYWYLLHSFDFIIQKTLNPEFSFGFDTLTKYPDANPETNTCDGYVGKSNVANLTFAGIFNNATPNFSTDSSSADTMNLIICGTTTSRYNEMYRAIFMFDTSSIGSNSTISAGILSIYGLDKGSYGGDVNVRIGKFTSASYDTALSADAYVYTNFEARNNGSQYADWNLTSWLLNYNDVDLSNSTYGISDISKTSITRYGTVSYMTVWGDSYQEYLNCYYADNTGTTKDPKLVVTYTAAPTVTTQAVSSILDTTATGNGNVTSDGGSAITERGICWKTSTGPTTADSKATSAGTTGAYTASMTGLTASTLYYVKAYAINSIGTSYGSEVTFTSSASVTAIKTINGIAIADIKTINGIAGASIKSIMGLTYVQPVLWYGERGVFDGGRDAASAISNVIDYITIVSAGNATDFGDNSLTSFYHASLSGNGRGITGGGAQYINVISYITIATTGNATDFGDLLIVQDYLAGVSSGIRGCFGGGYDANYHNNIEYITIATTGNSTDFGDLTVVRGGFMGSCSSSTKGIFSAGRDATTYYNTIDCITIATTGNATDFGDSTDSRMQHYGESSGIRGIFVGGYNSLGVTNTIDYITIATTGNATDFGDTVPSVRFAGTTTNATYICFGGGLDSSAVTLNNISYITIMSTGNSSDFGDLTLTRYSASGCSGN